MLPKKWTRVGKRLKLSKVTKFPDSHTCGVGPGPSIRRTAARIQSGTGGQSAFQFAGKL